MNVRGQQFGVVIHHGSQGVLRVSSETDHTLHDLKVVFSNELLRYR